VFVPCPSISVHSVGYSHTYSATSPLAVTLNVTRSVDTQKGNVPDPEILEGWLGACRKGFTSSSAAFWLSPQTFLAFTVTLPADSPTLTEICVVPCPDTIFQPAGTVQT